MPQPVLVVDDDGRIRASLRRILEGEGYGVAEASNGVEALQQLTSTPFSCVLLDLKMPLVDGDQVFRELRGREVETPVIILTGHGDIPMAVEYIKAGAFDFIEKPPPAEKIKAAVRQAVRQSEASWKLKSHARYEGFRYTLIGSGPAMQTLRDSIAKVAQARVPVLITGESGTGKELAAREIHRQSNYRNGPFIQVNCAALPDELIESELFGHEKGAFTDAKERQMGKFVLAHKGALFLDEIGDMSPRAQAKMLRVLEQGEVEALGSSKGVAVDIKVIAATNQDLEARIREGRFREDLFFRLNGFPLRVPPLREHPEDIPALMEHFAAFFCWENNLPKKSFDPDVAEALKRQPWKGNVRELKNFVERLLIFAPGDAVTLNDLPPAMLEVPGAGSPEAIQEAAGLQDFLDRMERVFLLWHLRLNGGNIKKTAERLGLPRSHLYRSLTKLNIPSEDYRED
jgi:two-component system, NtrC family, nitrogen regulation response regulator NtrX